MVFGSLFGNPVKLSLLINKNSYMPGEDLVYRINVDAKKDVDLRELKVELIGVLKGRTTCWYEEDEEETYSRDTDFSITVFREEQVLLSNVKLRKGSYIYSGSFTIPLDAVYSGKRNMLEAEWFLRAIARRTFRSSQAENRITIVNNRVNGGLIDRKIRLGDALAIVKLPEYLRAGAIGKGVLQLGIGGGEEYCKELLVEVVNSVRIDKYTIDPNAENCNEINFTKTIMKKKLAENTSLNIQNELPFEIQIPENSIPSFDKGRAYSKWMLKITCKKGLLKKEEFNIPLKVT